jgi:hypothetical protein
VLAPLVAGNDAAAAEAGRPPVRVVDWTARGKEAVAAGAALAAYYRDHAPGAEPSGGDRLVFDVGRLRRDLPFSLLMLVAGRAIPTLLLRAGRSFEPDGAGLAPLTAAVAWQARMTFLRCGGRLTPAAGDDVGLLTQYLGYADLPDDDRGPVRVELLPDHQVRVVTAGGRVVPVNPDQPTLDPLDDPFAGRL